MIPFIEKGCSPSFIFYFFAFSFLSLMIHTFAFYMDGSMAFGLDWVRKVEGVYHVYHEEVEVKTLGGGEG
jgi:hypothetical protein